MNYAARTSVLFAGLLIAAACATGNGPGGGHGGSGGHASGGHASGGHAGHSFSASSSHHSLAHSVTHMFHHGPKHRAFGQPVAFFPRHRHFGSFGCTNDLLFPRFASQFNCFNTGFFFDPFFFGAYSMLGPLPDETSAYLSTGFPPAETMNSEDAATFPSNDSEGPQTVTLLQLLDGSMYGLTSYKVVGHELHYTTTYGGQNSIPLDRIDFAQTLKLNAERHVPFLLEPTKTPR